MEKKTQKILVGPRIVCLARKDTRNEGFTENVITFIFEKSQIDKKFVLQSMMEDGHFTLWCINHENPENLL